jgi:hypothetical protein
MKGIQQKSYGEVRGSFESQVDRRLGKPKEQAVNGLKEFFESHGLKYDGKIHDAQRHILASIGVSSKINKVLGGSKFTRPIAALLGFGMGSAHEGRSLYSDVKKKIKGGDKPWGEIFEPMVEDQINNAVGSILSLWKGTDGDVSNPELISYINKLTKYLPDGRSSQEAKRNAEIIKQSNNKDI